MKITKERSKKVWVIVLIVAVTLAFLTAVGLIINSVIKSKEGKEVYRITISSMPKKTVYYVGEEFKPEGTSIQVYTKDMFNTYFVDYKELKFEGFDSSEPNESLKVKVTYGDFSTEMILTVKEPEPVAPHLVSIELLNFISTYKIEEWNTYGPDSDGATLKCTHSDGTEKEIPLKYEYIFGANKVDAPGEYEITVKYSEGAIQKEISVKITITE